MQRQSVLQVKSQDTLLPPPHGQLAPSLVAPPIAFYGEILITDAALVDASLYRAAGLSDTKYPPVQPTTNKPTTSAISARRYS